MHRIAVVSVVSVVSVVVVLAGGGCGEPQGGRTADGGVRDPDPPVVELTRSGGCGDAFMWAATESGDIAVTVLWNRPVEERNRAADVRFEIPDDRIIVNVERGRALERNMCTDAIDMESEPESVRPASAGRGHLVVGEVDPVTWRGRATLTLEGLEGPDGLRFAPAELVTDQIGMSMG